MQWQDLELVSHDSTSELSTSRHHTLAPPTVANFTDDVKSLGLKQCAYSENWSTVHSELCCIKRVLDGKLYTLTIKLDTSCTKQYRKPEIVPNAVIQETLPKRGSMEEKEFYENVRDAAREGESTVMPMTTTHLTSSEIAMIFVICVESIILLFVILKYAMSTTRRTNSYARHMLPEQELEMGESEQL